MELKDYIPWLISLGGFIVALITLSRNGRKDRKAEYVEEADKIHEIEKTLAEINTKLDSMQNTLKETRTDVKSINTSFQELDKRVTTIENNLKTVWLRIDELKDKVGFYHDTGH